jgi:ATP-binding cassette subfamily B protein
MSDAYDIDDEREGGQRKASFAQVAAFMWKQWSSQPGKLAMVGLLFGVAIVADLAMPFASKHLVDALTAGPSEAEARKWRASLS